MLKFITVVALLLCVALAFAEPRQGSQNQQQQLQIQLRSGAADALPNNPYLFLTVPRANGKGHDIKGFRVVEGDNDDNNDDEAAPLNNNDDDDDTNDDDDYEEDETERDDDASDINNDNNDEFENDDDDDDNMDNDVTNNLVYLRSRIPHTPRLRSQLKNQASAMSLKANREGQLNAQLVLKNAKPTNMMVSREHAGAIMVPDGFIEIEGQSVFDENTGKTSLLVPRNVLDAIPEGSVVALVDNSAQDSEEARANRVIVRRRRKGSRRNVVRRRGGNRRRRGGQRRRVQVYRIGGSNRRRRGRRPVVLQG